MRIVLQAFGSLGDLHPSLALGLELRARGHDVTLACCANSACPRPATMAARAAEVGRRVRTEDGAKAAADAIAGILQGPARP